MPIFLLLLSCIILYKLIHESFALNIFLLLLLLLWSISSAQLSSNNSSIDSSSSSSSLSNDLLLSLSPGQKKKFLEDYNNLINSVGEEN